MQIAGMISILMILLMFFAVVKAHPQGKGTSISQHAAKKRWTYLLFGTVLTLFGGLFLLFIQNSFDPLIQTPTFYLLLMPIAWILLLVTAWVPDRVTGRMSKMHQIAAFGLAFMMTLIISSLVFASDILFIFRVLGAITSIWYLFTLYLFFFVKKSLQHFLVYQTINIVSFFGLIISVFVVQSSLL